jgi:FkbM family methyltransferase
MSDEDKILPARRGFGFGAWSAEPLRTVRLGRRLTSAPLPRGLEGLRTLTKRLAWTAVEARQVDAPVRYALRELVTRRRATYAPRGGGSRFIVRHRSGDIEIFRKFHAYGYYSLPAEVESRLRALQRPLGVLDLGANIGFFETFTRDLLPIGEVVCFEPDPYNRAVLEEVRAANAASWEIVPACASNRDGSAQFSTGHKNLSRIASGGDVTIETRDVFPYIAAADLVKMNIEGSEWEVMRDARFPATAAVWIVEYHRIANPEPDIHELAKRLFEDAGYTVRVASESVNNGLLWAWRA